MAVLVSVMFIGVLSFFIWCLHRQWYRNRKRERNSELQTNMIDSPYQELDLTRKNTEDNYQSLRFKTPQSNFKPETTKVDTTYQQLDLSNMNTEDNYQSLMSCRVSENNNYSF